MRRGGVEEGSLEGEVEGNLRGEVESNIWDVKGTGLCSRSGSLVTGGFSGLR